MGKIRRIQEEILRDLDAFKALAEKATGAAELARHYGLPNGGPTMQWLRDLIKQVGVSQDTLKENRSKANTLYPWVTKTCPTCSNPFETQQGHPKEGTYCSHVCANRDPAHLVRTPEQREKTRQTLLAKHEAKGLKPGRNRKARQERPCARCQTVFFPKRDLTKYCPACRGKASSGSPEHRAKLRQIQLDRIANGTHKGWKSRAKVNVSYAERFFMKVLQLNGVPYQHEVPESSYFIDFAIELPNGHKIALEIDGKQHKLPERAASDARKDEALRKAGWCVHRIPWCSINSDAGKQRMKAQIDAFLTLYRSLLNAGVP